MKSKNANQLLKRVSDVVGNFTVSISYDNRLYEYDILGSKAHSTMLAEESIITPSEKEAIHKGLDEIAIEIKQKKFPWDPGLEDVHMNIESRLHEKIGSTAGKLHTARSRNDQVSLDTRMFVKDAVSKLLSSLTKLELSIVNLAKRNITVVLPGYTHMQRAQPVLFAHHMLAYYEMLERDRKRLEEVYNEADVMPLGSGALAGTPFPINRLSVAKILGFKNISQNSMDAVSDRDYLLSFLFTCSTCIMHLSRFAEEIINWSTSEFNFIQLSAEYTTGSSIMPQKRNPDFAEISRGKTGRVYGNLFTLFTVLKGLPLTYNRDLQEDKEALFDSYDTTISVLTVFEGMLNGININESAMINAAKNGLSLATDVADYLVTKGLPFREAHFIVNKISDYAKDENKNLGELTLQEYQKFSKQFENDVLDISIQSSIDSRNITGGTSSEMVTKAVNVALLKVKSYEKPAT
jgi:argininosuccinate lyase